MALILTESWDSTSSAAILADKWNLGLANGIGGSGPGRTGANGWVGANGTAGRQVAASEESATFIYGGAQIDTDLTFFGSGGTGKKQISFKSDAGVTEHVYLQTGASDPTKLEVYRGGGTLLGSSASGVVKAGIWQYFEMKVTLSDTVGAVVVRVDETVVINLSGIDTKNGGTKTVLDSIVITGNRNGTTGVNTRFDDIYLCNGAGLANTDFLGAVRVECLLPNGNGASTGMTNSAGNSVNNYSYVDDQMVTTDYVESDSAKDTYTFADSAQPTGNSVKGVAVYEFAEKTDAGARGLSAVARLSGTEALTDVGALTNGAYHVKWAIFETKPGGGAWTVGDVNNAEFGQQAT
jgi:hypothetical protein